MAKVAQEKPRDEEARTTDIGLFNFAASYQKAADVLARSKARATHKAHVIQYLRYHAIELYLKAYLRGHGISVAELRSKRYAMTSADYRRSVKPSACR